MRARYGIQASFGQAHSPDQARSTTFETSFGAINPKLLDRDLATMGIPLFSDGHSIPDRPGV